MTINEDQKRDPDGGRGGPDEFDMFAERPGGRSGVPDSDSEAGDKTAEQGPPPLDEAAVERHKAAKQARIREREEKANPKSDDPPRRGMRRGKGSALPAIRPEMRPDTPALRAERVEAIRRDLVRRRRRKGGGMLLKLWLVVFLPTLLVAGFLWFKASDLYRSDSVFTVQNADVAAGAAAGGLLGSLVGGGGAVYDSVAVQSFILSRDVLRRLDDEHGLIAHFQDPDLDWFHRLPPDTSFENAYEFYKKMVSVSFDPTEGVLEMSLVAADPDSAERFSHAIIGYAEEMVDQLSDPIRADAMRDSERNLAEAEQRLKDAQLGEARVRKAQDTFSVEGEVSAEMGIIGAMEGELETLKARLTNLRRVTSETDPRVERIRAQVETLTAQVEERRKNLTGDRAGGSLADVNAALSRAQIDVQAAMLIFTAALEAREISRADAARQHRYLSVVSVPSLPDESNYPKKWELTALAFLSFLGLYIIGSLTISLIREQASI